MIKIQRPIFITVRKLEYRCNYVLHKTTISGNHTENKTNNRINIAKNNKDIHGHKINICIIGGGLTPIFAAVCLKQFILIKSIHVIDPKDAMVSAVSDVNHIDTSPGVKYFRKSNIQQGLKGMDIIALMDETDLDSNDIDTNAQFKSASSYVCEMTDQMMQYSPESLVAVFVRPVTGTLPLISEIYKWAGLWDPAKIIGSVSIDSMRVDAITASLLNLNPAFLSVPVIGGADSNTIVPLLSCAEPINRFTNEHMLLQTLRGADTEIAKIGSRGPTFSAGFAAAKLILSLANGLSGFESVACAFVRSNVLPFCRFFTNKLLFGRCGVKKNFGIPKASPFELTQIEQAIPLINKSVQAGISVIHNDGKKKS